MMMARSFRKCFERRRRGCVRLRDPREAAGVAASDSRRGHGQVAARPVAAANARAEDAERRAFETEERAAARVADVEHDARQAADALGDARRVIAELEHHVAETAMRRTSARARRWTTVSPTPSARTRWLSEPPAVGG